MDYNKYQGLYSNFQGENIDLSTDYSYTDRSAHNNLYSPPIVSGRLNPEYYRADEDNAYGYGADQLLYGKEKLHDNYGIPYPAYKHKEYAGNKAGFQSMQTVNNNTYLLILLIIFVVITMVTVIMNFVLNISAQRRTLA